MFNLFNKKLKQRIKANPDIEEGLIEVFSRLCNNINEVKDDVKDIKGKSKAYSLKNKLEGFRASLLLDSCSGVGYVTEDNQFYYKPDDIEGAVTRVVSVDALINYLDDMLDGSGFKDGI